MKEKFQELLDQYYDKAISLDDFIFNFQILHRERIKKDTDDLKDKLHPKLLAILPDLIKKVEKKTNLLYYGIIDGMEGHDPNLHHYHVVFQHIYYFNTQIELSVGVAGSCGDKYYVEDDNKIHLCIQTPSCGAVWGECSLDSKNLVKELLPYIEQFNEEYGEIY